LGIDQPTKTGWRQGVVVYFPLVAQRLRDQVTGRPSDEPVFPGSELTFAGAFAQLAERRGLGAVTPHVLRHSGATYFGAVAKWTVDDLRLRGRWKAVESVARYVKPAALVEAWAALPVEVAALAREFERDPAEVLTRAALGA